jgi:hypothetical protein
MDWDNDKMEIHYNNKKFIIPVTMHKVKNKFKVNCAIVAQDSKSLVSDQILQETNRDENNNVPFDKWCTPAGFSLDSANLTLKKNM